MKGWKMVKLGGIVDTQKGYAFKSAWYQKIGIPVIRVSDFTKDSVNVDSAFKISKEKATKYKRYELAKGDTVIQTVGSWGSNPNSIVGKVVKIPSGADGTLLNQNAVKIIPKDILDRDFLFYRLKEKSFEGHVLNFAQGAANQASITLKSIRDFKFLVPPLPTQQKIARLLSRYDDLIENNLRRIKLLEELARVTYEEWFVRGRFPGWEEVEVDEETGLPVGWRNRKLGTVCKYAGGGTPSKKQPEYWEDGDIPWFSPTDLTKASSIYVGDSANKINELGLIKSSAKLMGPESFMMSSRATIGLFGISEKPFSTNQGFINITPLAPSHKAFLIYNLKGRIEEMINFSTGSTFLELTKGKFKLLKIKWPTEDVLDKFSSIVDPYLSEIIVLEKQNTLLREARDLLLPRLMAGVVDLDEMEEV